MSRRRPGSKDGAGATASQGARLGDGRRRRVVAVVGSLALVAATVLTFRPVLDHPFLNWDDPDVVAGNPALAQPLSTLVPWAFSTREMGHYQPLSWLVLAAAAGAPLSPARVHAAALALHVLNALLLAWLIAWLVDRGDGDRARWALAVSAAALFALHPLRVEPVAWASALPYPLSYTLVLASVAAWAAWLRHDRGALRWLAVALFALSQLARVTAPLLAVVLAALAWLDPRTRPRHVGTLLRALAPFVVVGLGLALVEASAREVERDIGLGPRVAWAMTHPALYLWRTAAPVALTTLDVLPREPHAAWGLAVAALAALAAAIGGTWRWWSPAVALGVWGSYLALLAPVVGLFPSGLQVTADRYTYGPALVLSVAVAAALASARVATRLAVAAGVAVVAGGLAVAAHAQTAHWRDSIALWSRAVALDADNDVARYNLALALIDAGQPADAEAQLDVLVAQVPDHDLGRARRAALRADRAQHAADAAASAGRLAEAVRGYTDVLTNDPGRSRARLNRGMALVQLGDTGRAVGDLEAAGAAETSDAAVAGALALAWAETGRTADAIRLLRRVREHETADVGLAMNLARLLLTAAPAAGRNPQAALEIAASVNDVTGGRDPRVLATLAEALAATGRRGDAANAWDVAIAVATESGNAAFAADLRRRRTVSNR